MKVVRKCEVVGYSERGMVNELVHFIRTNENPVEMTRHLLSDCLEFVGDFVGDPVKSKRLEPAPIRSEVAKILTKMDDVTFIVESSFAQFGDPDLVVVPKSKGKNLALFFIEAKVIDYEHSAKLCKDPLDMTQKGFNSTIIGQLSLRYRLSKALAHRDRDEWDEDKGLVENNGIAKAYAKMEGALRRRKLSKLANLKHLLPEFRLAETDLKVWEKRCFFIALTSDLEIPFAGDYALLRGQNPLGYEDSEDKKMVPHYYSAMGSPCKDAIERTGWMGWSRIEERFHGALERQCGFQKTWNLALPIDSQIKAMSSRCTEQHAAIQTRRWSSEDAHVEALREHWKQVFLSYRQDDSDSMISYAKYEGSDSGKYGPQTVFKLLNLSDGYALALREDFGIPIDPSIDEPVCIMRVPFRMKRFVPGEDDTELRGALSRYLEELRERK